MIYDFPTYLLLDVYVWTARLQNNCKKEQNQYHLIYDQSKVKETMTDIQSCLICNAFSLKKPKNYVFIFILTTQCQVLHETGTWKCIQTTQFTSSEDIKYCIQD